MSHSELLSIAADLAASLASIQQHLPGALKGSGVSLSVIEDALAAAESALDGSPLGPLADRDDASHPSTWPSWCDNHRVGLAVELTAV